MKLIKQTHLVQDRGNSQRIHEIDLCELAAQEYVVNFRYGRSGRRMQEGSHTTSPVDRAQAEKIFRKAVKDKTKKGYYDPAAAQRPPVTRHARDRNIPKEEATRRHREKLLIRLRAGDARYPEWPLNRAIWRAGELAFKEAAPEILQYLLDPKSDALRRHVAIWALGRCESQSAVSAISTAFQNQREPAANRRMAGEALRSLLDGSDRQTLIDAELEQLPGSLQKLARRGPAQAVVEELERLSRARPRVHLETIYSAYFIDNEHTRPAVIDFCKTTSMDSDALWVLRALYKAAVFRFDGQIFGLLAHKFETSAVTRRFGGKTKNYYRWRTWRTLRRMGEEGHDEWIKMALGTLVPFSTADSRHGSFSSYWAFNHLLYHNSRVYRPDGSQSYFVNRQSLHQTGQSAYNEEAFPELWDKAPTALLHLIDESDLDLIHVFAVRALKRNTAFLSKIDDPAIAMLLGRPVEATAAFGLELFDKRGEAKAEDSDLFLALSDSIHQPAREAGWRLIDRFRAELGPRSDFWVALAFSRHQDTRQRLKNILKTIPPIGDTGRLLVGRLIARLIGESPDDAVISDVSELLLQPLGAQTSQLGLGVIRDLLDQTGSLYEELAGELLLANPTLSASVPSDVLAKLLAGSTESARAAGVALLGRLAPRDLAQRPELFFSLLTSAHPDLRAAVRPLVRQIVSVSSAFAALIGESLLEQLRYRDKDDIHTHLRQLLKTEFQEYMRDLDQKEVLKLLNSRFKEAQRLGTDLLETHVNPATLSLGQLIRLVNHESQKVRQWGCSFCEQQLPVLKDDMIKAVRLLDAKWDDSRERMIELFGERFDRTDLSPAILVSICDSVRPDVQQFGRSLITRFFDDRDGPEYLQKLSEHPSVDLQLFATNYLERFAADNVDRIKQLTPYFVSVLSKINTGRIAKARVLTFLEQQALNSRSIAEVVAPIFERQSVTMAVENKALMIEAMVRLRDKYPDLELPVSLKAFEARAAEVSDAV